MLAEKQGVPAALAHPPYTTAHSNKQRTAINPPTYPRPNANLPSMRRTAALAIAGRATERLPASYNAWALKGSIETKLQQHSDAVKSYTIAVRLKPDSPEPLRALALARWSNGQDAEASQSFEQLIKRFPQNAECYEAYGTALFKTASNEAL